MKGWTRRGGWIRMLALGILLPAACGEGASEGGSAAGASPADTAGQAPADRPVPPAEADAAGAGEWVATVPAHAPPGFRPAAWEDERTIVGLARSRIVRVRVDTALVLPGPPGLAWSVDAAPGVLSWTNEAGWWIQRAGGEPELRVRMEEAPAGTDGPPEVLWSPDGRRALLTWTGEGRRVYALMRSESQRVDTFSIRLAGFMPPRPLLWLDHDHVLLDARALARRDGTGRATEAGERGDLALLEPDDRTVQVVVGADDDRFLSAAGMLAGDSLLVLERDREGRLVGSWTYDTTSWQRRLRPVSDGRAQAHPTHRAAIVTTDRGTRALHILDQASVHRIEGVLPAESESVAWSPDGTRLAVLDASRQPARLVIVRPTAN